jgi:ssDNA-binding Zn-finger/Zn-ribbon topoisomerase 1
LVGRRDPPACRPLVRAIASAKHERRRNESEYRCPRTGKPLLLRPSRFGPFLGCSNYPPCRKVLKLNPDGTPLDGENIACGIDEFVELPAADKPTIIQRRSRRWNRRWLP